jgi:hypothetical protein
MYGLAFIQADIALRLANERAAELRQQAANERLAERGPRFRWLREIVGAVSSLPNALTVIDDDRLVTPHLSDYPYRA